jgi:hypothetical protein
MDRRRCAPHKQPTAQRAVLPVSFPSLEKDSHGSAVPEKNISDLASCEVSIGCPFGSDRGKLKLLKLWRTLEEPNGRS